MGSIRKITQNLNQSKRIIHSSGVRPVSVPNFQKSTEIVSNKHKIVEFPVGDWFQNKKEVDISIIIPCYNSSEVITKQIQNWDFCENDGLSKEIIYVDDACPTSSRISIINSWNLKRKTLTNPVGKLLVVSPNSGFANACNFGAAQAKGKYLIFLNADTTVTKNWIKPMYDVFRNIKMLELLEI